MIPKWLPNRLSIGPSNAIFLMIFGQKDGCDYRWYLSRRIAFKQPITGIQSPLKWPLIDTSAFISGHAMPTANHTHINSGISAHLAAPRPFLSFLGSATATGHRRTSCKRTHNKKGRATSTTAHNPISIQPPIQSATPKIQAKSKQMYFSFFRPSHDIAP